MVSVLGPASLGLSWEPLHTSFPACLLGARKVSSARPGYLPWRPGPRRCLEPLLVSCLPPLLGALSPPASFVDSCLWGQACGLEAQTPPSHGRGSGA